MCVAFMTQRTENLLVTDKGSIRAVHVPIQSTSFSGRMHGVVDVNVEVVGGGVMY